MEELKVKGLVLKANDYREKDSLVTLLTAELGKITVLLKGVKNANAKLKWATQPFFFADWVIIKKNEYFTVSQVDSIYAFYEIINDYDKYVLASFVSEIANISIRANMVDSSNLVNLLNYLKLLLEPNNNEYLITIKYILNIIKSLGYELQFKNCTNCKCPIVSDIMFSYEHNNFTCKSCAGLGAFVVNKNVYNILKFINNASYENLNSVKTTKDVLLKCIGLLKTDLENILDFNFKSIECIFV